MVSQCPFDRDDIDIPDSMGLQHPLGDIMPCHPCWKGNLGVLREFAFKRLLDDHAEYHDNDHQNPYHTGRHNLECLSVYKFKLNMRKCHP